MDLVLSFKIPAGELSEALDAFSTQSGIQVMYTQEAVANRRTPEVEGTLTSAAALERLLQGTGIIWESVNSSTIVLKPNSAHTDKVKKSPDRLSEERGKQDTKVLSEVLVVGSKSLNVDVARSRNDIQPYVVFDREDITSSMAANIEEFLVSRLPMNQTDGPAARAITPSADYGNRSRFNLRGLGTNQTLILVNGRRAPGVSRVNASGGIDQPDVNGIPLSAIERIEVLPATASGIYGGGATGGVINVVLRSDYEGSTMRLSYDNTFDTDSAKIAADVATTLSLEEGRTQVTVAASRSEANSLLERDRNFAREARELAFRNAPDLVFAYANPLTSGLTNISSLDGENLILLDGTDLGSRITYVPIGYGGVDTDGGLALIANAGQYDLSIPNTTFGGGHELGQTPTTTSAYITIKREFGDRLSAYLDLSSTRNQSLAQTSNIAGAALYPGSPGNPFQNFVVVNVPAGGTPIPRLVESNTQGVNGGAVLRFNDNWTGGLDLRWNKSTNKNDYRSLYYDPFLIGDAIRSGDLNVFRDLSAYPLDLSPFISTERFVFGPATAYSKEAAARISGAYLTLPGGTATMTASVSHRKESTGELMFDLGGYGFYQYFPSRYQTADSLYAETVLPLVGDTQMIPFVHQLDAQISVRRDSYTTVGVPASESIYLTDPDGPIPAYTTGRNAFASNDYTLGLRYMPNQELAIRASLGTGFLPPAVTQVAANETFTSLYVMDPRRGNQYQTYNPVGVFFAGGSEELEPEQSRSLSVGAIYAPSDLGFRLSVDYTRIKKTGEIAGLSIEQLLLLEDRFPGRIERGDRLPGDPADWAGVITRIDATLLNIAESEVEAVDIQADTSWDIGKYGWLETWAVATRQMKLARRVLSDLPMQDEVGYRYGPLTWRGAAGIKWVYRDFQTQLSAQYYDSYKVYSAESSPSNIEYWTRLQGSAEIPSQTYFDASVEYRVPGGWLEDARLVVGVKNIFNRKPPIIASTTSIGGYSTYGDPRMRSYFVSLEASF